MFKCLIRLFYKKSPSILTQKEVSSINTPSIDDLTQVLEEIQESESWLENKIFVMVEEKIGVSWEGNEYRPHQGLSNYFMHYIKLTYIEFSFPSKSP